MVIVLEAKFGGNPFLTVIKPEMWSNISSTNFLCLKHTIWNFDVYNTFQLDINIGDMVHYE